LGKALPARERSIGGLLGCGVPEVQHVRWPCYRADPLSAAESVKGNLSLDILLSTQV